MFPELCVAKVLCFPSSVMQKLYFSAPLCCQSLCFPSSELQKLHFSRTLCCKSSVCGTLRYQSLFPKLWVAKALFPELWVARALYFWSSGLQNLFFRSSVVPKSLFLKLCLWSSMFPRFVSLELCCRSTIFPKFSVHKGLYDISPRHYIPGVLCSQRSLSYISEAL